MDLSLSEEQILLRDAARDFLASACPESHVRDMEHDERGYSPDLWRQMAEQGWFGLLVPERFGGSEMTLLDLLVLVEEFGRSLVPGPALPTLISSIALLECASEVQQQQYLPPIAAGERLWTLAFTEPSASFEADGVGLTARPEDGQYVLNGTKLFIRDSHVVDQMVVVGRVESEIALFVVDARAPGVCHTPIRSIAADKQCAITFDDVRVPSDARLGGWTDFQRAVRKATVLECAYLVGLSQRAFEITLEYTKQRIQFDKVIATFQALQHQATDLVTDVDASRYITYKAAWAVHADEPDADLDMHVAKAFVSEASRRVVARAQGMHGGIGFTRDYPIQLYYRRQKAAELAWGDAEYHREYVCRALGI
jgi:alkylation response protein AidB-like acyl-CoA dehydrogenase